MGCRITLSQLEKEMFSRHQKTIATSSLQRLWMNCSVMNEIDLLGEISSKMKKKNCERDPINIFIEVFSLTTFIHVDQRQILVFLLGEVNGSFPALLAKADVRI